MRTNGLAASPRPRRLAVLVAALIVVAVAPGIAGAQQPMEPMMVTVDQAAVLRLPTAAGTIIVGNPAIADATVVDAMTLVITGRSFGQTNLIVLDANGTIIAEEQIIVQTATEQVVVYRRSVRQTYSCTPICAPILNVGDANPAFETTTDQITARAALAAQ